MPTLYSVPIIHSPEDWASLKDALLALHIKISSEEELNERLKKIEHYWQEVEQRMQLAGLYQPEIASRLHIFVDGLPDTTEILVHKIVGELIARKITAYLLIKPLLENGAKIHGTDDPKLLLKEHSYWTGISQGQAHNIPVAEAILKDRDCYIAQRIISTVPEEEIALLFIGRKHNVIGELNVLSKNFKVADF